MDQHDRIKLVLDGSGTYRKYSGPDIIEAARMVQEDHYISVYKVTKEKGIPWSSLKRYVTENPDVISAMGLKQLGRPFSMELETEQKVFNCVISMQELRFGLTVEQVKVIAFDVDEASGRGHFFNTQKRRASKKCWRNFKERYGLTLRIPANLFVYKASMGNSVMIDDYFDKLSETTKKLKIQDNLKDHIWNVDETGLMYAVKPNKFFLDSTDGSYKPKLLLMDSHGAHIMPQVSELAKENSVYILTFQSHTTHILQPLDVGVYKALKYPRQKELYDCMIEHPTDKPNKQDFHSIFKVPFIKTMSKKNIMNAFRTCGIVPSARTVIPKQKLVPSLLTERPVPQEVVPSDANPRPTTAETNPGIQTPPYPVDNIMKPPTAGPRKELTHGRVRPNPKAKFITENSPTVHQTVNKQRPQKQQKVEVRHAAPGPSGVQHRGKATKNKTNVCVYSARPTVDDDDWTCGICNERFSKDKS
ncbi:hypothetical protein PR048_010619 [Dryococelus australis]|uniref:DDE-1 domain-containing protein n=1 Tax=Dryococelus australis TaxID=614101 RepID=A0ABQ9I373_9NEOP|nr:hypothetical protein PR048_010619 [Dryococelus australis]